ncbi:MAG: SMI1/KNR4 family protein [Gammaproteobacteria bacterium]|nr:SMI1/KNR4 family protein [Gammaproteobacteria bacterium]
MSVKLILDKVKNKATEWGEALEPPAKNSEINELAKNVFSKYSIEIPDGYRTFLSEVNGLEFNGLIIFGTKNSEVDSDGSPINFMEMNEVMDDSIRARFPELIVIGENSTGLLTFDSSLEQFQFRDRVGLDRVDSYTSFENMLELEVFKVM